MLLFHLFLLFPCAMSLCSGVLSDTYVCVDFVFRLVYSRSSRMCYLWLVSWLANLLLFARKASFCLLYWLVVMYSAVLILMLILCLYLTSMNKWINKWINIVSLVIRIILRAICIVLCAIRIILRAICIVLCAIRIVLCAI